MDIGYRELVALTREFIVNIQDPEMNGLLRSFTSEAKAPIQRFVWGDGEEIGVRVVRPKAGDQNQPFEDAYETGMALRVAVGFGHRAPTGGTFNITLRNTSTSNEQTTDDILWSASAADFKTALDEACDGLSMLAATVTKSGIDYIIETADLSFSIVAATSALSPECTVVYKEMRANPSGATTAIWRVRVAQNGIAYASLTDPYDTLDATVTATSLQTGDDTKPSIQRLTLDPMPIGGTGLISWGQPEKTKVITAADGESSLMGDVAVTLYDADGSRIDVVLSDGTGSLPAVPPGGSQVVVSYTTNDDAAAIATAIAGQINGGSTHTASASDDVVIITAVSDGSRVTSIAGTSGFTVSREQRGYLFSRTVPWNASEDELVDIFDDTVGVSIVARGVYDFTFADNGAKSAITIATANLITPKGLKGTLSFDTLAAQEEFAADPDADYLTPTLSVEMQYSGKEPKTALRTGCQVYRDIVTTV